MAVPTLCEKLTPFKEQHRTTPDSALQTLKAVDDLQSTSITCKLSTGSAAANVAGLHPVAGGHDPAISGGLGTMGMDKMAPVGFVEIRMAFELDMDTADKNIAKLVSSREMYCVTLQIISQKPRIKVSSKNVVDDASCYLRGGGTFGFRNVAMCHMPNSDNARTRQSKSRTL
ncbi:MAG: hypothetical protein Q9184_004054 [Pyrenodesmia sp. 2 TL-2023]